MTTYAERLTKIYLVVAEIFGRICRFLPSRPNRCSCYPRNLWGYWTECHKIVLNVDKFITFNTVKSRLQYCNLFWNGSATKEIGPRKCQFFDFSWLPWQNTNRKFHAASRTHWSVWPYTAARTGRNGDKEMQYCMVYFAMYNNYINDR